MVRLILTVSHVGFADWMRIFAEGPLRVLQVSLGEGAQQCSVEIGALVVLNLQQTQGRNYESFVGWKFCYSSLPTSEASQTMSQPQTTQETNSTDAEIGVGGPTFGKCCQEFQDTMPGRFHWASTVKIASKQRSEYNDSLIDFKVHLKRLINVTP